MSYKRKLSRFQQASETRKQYKNYKKKPEGKVGTVLDASIIITCMGSEYLGFLKKTFPTKRYQVTDYDYEIIVVAYKDKKVKQWAESFAEESVRCVYVPESGDNHFNSSHARNIGARRAKGNVLIFADADSYLAPQFVENAVQELYENEIEAFISSESGKTDRSGTFAISRGRFFLLKGFSQYTFDLSYYEDTDLHERVKKYGVSHFSNNFVDMEPNLDSQRIKRRKNSEKFTYDTVTPNTEKEWERLKLDIISTMEQAKESRKYVNPEGFGIIESKPHFVVVSPWLIRGGAEKVTVDMVNALQRDCDVTLVTTEDDLSYPLVSHLDDATIWKDHVHCKDVVCLGTKEDRQAALVDLIEQRQPNGIIINQSLVGFESIEKLNYPCMVVLHHVEQTRLDNRFNKFGHTLRNEKYIDQAFVVTEHTKEYLIENDFPERKVKCQRWCIDHEQYKPQADLRKKGRKILGLNDEVLIGMISRFSHRKNIKKAIREIAQLSGNFKFVMVGCGETQKEVAREVRNQGLIKKVVMTGELGEKDLNCVRQAIDIGFLTSKQEGCPLSLQEIMACETPVVASNVKANDELIDDSVGILVDGGKYSQPLQSLLDNPHKRYELGKAARNKIIEKFNYRTCIGNFRKISKELIKQ